MALARDIAGVFEAVKRWRSLDLELSCGGRFRETAVITEASSAAEFILERVERRAGRRAYQGRRNPPIAIDAAVDSPAVRNFAEHRWWNVGELEARGLVGWAGGRRLALLCDRLLEPREIVELQAEGRRCVALVGGGDEEALEIALHDLRHLEKFFDPDHHRAQIGFFRMIAAALATRDSIELDRDLDETWCTERDKVLADMNGCPIFLFAVLKMKLKVAARRKLARDRGVAPPARGVLDDEELRAHLPLLERLLDSFGLEGEVREAARAISARRDHPANATILLRHFQLR